MRSYAKVLLLSLVELAACGAGSAAGPPPKADDWSTSYVGDGSVEARIRNGSDTPIFVKLRNTEGITAAQAPVEAGAIVAVFLRAGHFRTQLRVGHAGSFQYFEAPPIDIPEGVASLELTLAQGLSSNLRSIGESEFQQ